MIKESKGITAVDVSIAVVAIIIFTSIIVSMMANVKLENTNIRRKAIATIYLTEILENVGIAAYDNVKENNAQLIPSNMPDVYDAQISVEKLKDSDATKEQDLIKKVTVSISYHVGNKEYTETIQRLKVKE